MFSLEKIKKEGKHFLIYGLGNIAQSALSFILLPVYMRYFSPDEYGIISILFIVVSFTSMVASTGLMSALHRLYFTVEGKKRKKLVGTTFTWYFVAGLILSGFMIMFAGNISRLLFKSAEYHREVRLIGVFFLFSFPLEIPFNILRLEKKSGSYVFFSLLRFSLDFVSKILLVIFLKRGVIGYLESGILSAFIVFLATGFYIIKYVSLSLRISFLKELLRLGVPFIFSGFAMWSLNVADRMILNYYWGQESVGLYAVGLKFSQIFKILLFWPFSLSLPAIVFPYAAKHTEAETKRLLSSLLKLLVFSGGILYLVVSLGTKDLIQIFTILFHAKEEYIQSISLVPILTLIQFCLFLTFPPSYSLLLVKKPEYTSISAGICAAVNIGLNFLMIPTMKEAGAAISTGISYIIYVLLVYFWAQRQYHVDFNWKSIFLGVSFICFVFFGFWFIPFGNYWAGLFLRTSVSLLVFFLLLFFFSGLLPMKIKKQIIRKINDFFTKHNKKNVNQANNNP
ncbi:MAG TPA: hypothetical protein ENI08_00110 [Candidatus Dependentiae bacterium]|nr:hypothetical protein [Candidatus Dependentiae bacterium]